MTEHDSAPGQPLMPPGDPHSGVELRHLRYLVAVVEAGTFTRAAERMFIAQPTLSQQVRRLEQLVGTPLLSRRRDGLHLTAAGSVLLEESRTVLSTFEHGLRRSRQAAGLDRLRLRFAVPPHLPESLAAKTVIRLRSVAAGAGVEVIWLEAPLDAEFTVIRRRQADAALGWLMPEPAALPHPRDAIELGRFEPELWIPAVSAGDRHVMSLDELAGMDVMHGPRRASPVVYDSWLAVLRGRRPSFELIDPPSRHSLAVALAFAATARHPAAVLSSPLWAAGDEATAGDVRQQAGDACDMVRVRLEGHPLTARAAVVWSSDLPRRLQQVLFDTADAGMALAGPVGDR